MIRRLAFVLMSAVVLPAAPAAAQTYESVYTDLELDKCRHTAGKEVEDYGFWRCRGFAGIAVRVAAGDQRTFVSFGPKAADEPAAAQTFPNFNSVDRVRIEWRLERRRQARKILPFAAIVRWNVKIDDDDKPSRGRVLVVTRLGEAVCQVGYVDAIANKNANELARELADKHAPHFDCGRDVRTILGERGQSVAGIAEAIAQEAAKKGRKPPPVSQ